MKKTKRTDTVLVSLAYRILLIPYAIGSLVQTIVVYPISRLLPLMRSTSKAVYLLSVSLMRMIVSTVDTVKKGLKRHLRKWKAAYKGLKKRYVLARIYIRGQSYYFKVAVIAALLGVAAFFFSQYAQTVPTVASYKDFARPAAVVITDREGTVLYSRFAQRKYTPVDSSRLSPHFIKATNIAVGGTFGQAYQVVRRAQVGKPENRIKNVLSAIHMMTHFSRRQIQDFYFTTTIYAGQVEGAQEAASTLVSQDIENIAPQEAVVLAALADCPLAPMPCDVSSKAASIAQVMGIDTDKIAPTPHLKGRIAYYKRAPWAVDMILETIKPGSDIVVRSSIDLSLQNELQQQVLEGKETAPAVTMDENGEISAIVGAPDYWAQGSSHEAQEELKKMIASVAKKNNVLPILVLTESVQDQLANRDL